MKKIFRRFKMMLRKPLGYIVRVRVYDNYVNNYRPALRWTNKMRWTFKRWIPIGSDSPFGRLCYIKAISEDGIVRTTYGRLSDMGKEFIVNGILFRVTHWQD